MASFGFGIFEEPIQSYGCTFVDHRSQRCFGIEWIATKVASGFFDEGLDKIVGNGLFYQNTAYSITSLARVAKSSFAEEFGRLFEVCIGEHKSTCLSSEFEVEPFHACFAGNVLPYGCGTSEAYRPYEGVAYQHITDFTSLSCENVDGSAWNACFLKDAGEEDERKRGVACWFDDDGVACQEGRDYLGCTDEEWIVERGYGGNHAEGFATNNGKFPLGVMYPFSRNVFSVENAHLLENEMKAFDGGIDL